MLVRGASNWFFCCLLVRKRKVKEDEGIALIKACGNLVSYWVSLVEHGLDLRDAWGVPFFWQAICCGRQSAIHKCVSSSQCSVAETRAKCFELHASQSSVLALVTVNIQASHL